VYQIQEEMAQAGFPCANVVHAPRLWPGGAAAVMSFLEGADGVDPHVPAVRTLMATLAAELVDALAPHRGRAGLPEQRTPDALWPRAHNVLFDLSAPGGEWIDERAREARMVLDAASAKPVLAHTDLSAANVRASEDCITSIYDMDSIALVDEMRLLAGMAVHFTYTGADDGWDWPTREEGRALVADYERARGRSLDRSERERLDADAVYALAYTARCEHALLVAGPPVRQDIRQRLREAPSRGYLSG
jgi:hypothetical protein